MKASTRLLSWTCMIQVASFASAAHHRSHQTSLPSNTSHTHSSLLSPRAMGSSWSKTDNTSPPAPAQPNVTSPTSTTTTTASTTTQTKTFSAAPPIAHNTSSTTSALHSTTTTTTSVTAQHSSIRSSQRSAKAFVTSQGTSSSTPLHQHQLKTHRPAPQHAINHANNYVIPGAAAREPPTIKPHREESYEKLLVCPQYNGRACVAEPCRRLHVCYHWATKTCRRSSCQHDHSLHSPHNQRLLQACVGKKNVPHIEVSEVIKKEQRQIFHQRDPEICLFSVSKKCTKESCPRVHHSKNYRWEVQHEGKWQQLFFNQSDYLEMMYAHPSEECVDLVPPKTPLPNNSALRRLAALLSREATWTVDLEAMQMKGGSAVLAMRRLSTVSDLTSQVPVATRWLWYWQGDDGCWEPYGIGVVGDRYHVALSDYLELMRIRNERSIIFSVSRHHYNLDIEAMTQTNLATNKRRSVRRRPACSLVQRESVRFDELFLPLPATKSFLKLPLLPHSSEFIFVENMLRQTLAQAKVASIHRVQNDHLWRAYQTKKRLLTSLYSGDTAATNEQYLFHGTNPGVIDLICRENLDWKLHGTNVGHVYGCGTYFSSLASKAHQYTRSDGTGRRVLLVVLVLVGKTTRGHKEMTLPPENTASGRSYDTTCDSGTNPTIFVKYNRDEYYPAYVVTYSYIDLQHT